MTVFRFFAQQRISRLFRAWHAVLPVLALPACVAAPQAPANAPRAAAALSAAPSVISLPVSIDLDQVAASLLRELPRPLLRSTQRRLVPVRHSSLSTSVASEPGICSVTELSCLARHSVRTVAADSLATVEAEVVQQMELRRLALAMNGSRLQWTAQLELAVDARLPPGALPLGPTSCGSGGRRPRFEVQQAGHVGWSPEGDVVLSPGPQTLRWLQPCSLGGLPGGAPVLLDVPALRDRLQALVEQQVLRRLREDSLRRRLAQAWPELNAPRALGAGVWLLPHPERVTFGELVGRGRFLSTAVLVQARPEIVRGPQPRLPVPPVPEPARGLEGSDGLRLAVRGDLSLVEAERQLRHNLAGRLRLVNGEPVVLERVRVWGNGDRAVIGLGFRQPALAELFLYARPVYDLERNQVAFHELAFTPASQAYLARVAGWMLGPGLLAAVEAQSRIRFDAGLAGALTGFRDLRLAAGRDLTLHGGVQRILPRELYFTQDRLVALLLLEGSLALEARQH